MPKKAMIEGGNRVDDIEGGTGIPPTIQTLSRLGYNLAMPGDHEENHKLSTDNGQKEESHGCKQGHDARHRQMFEEQNWLGHGRQ